MRKRDLIGLQYYERAKDAIYLNDKKRAIELFSNAFYLRSTSEDELDIEYHDFFIYQFSTYLVGKKRIKVSLPEGDMVADLIRVAYNEFQEQILDSPFNIVEENLWNLLTSVKIDFPFQIVPENLA